MSGFFRDPGVRETIESIVVAIMLALIFKAFEAEAYIIPTGSMAPTLRGEHFDIKCEQCGFKYQTNSSPNLDGIRSTYCPLCRYRTTLKPELLADHNSFDGDRILVNKFIYDFIEPKRWDVIVFKNPGNAKQNYIKRCCGLPNESLLIENGDLFTFDTRSENYDLKKIARKPPAKIRAMMQLVDDNAFIGPKLAAANWPLRWVPAHADQGQPNWTSEVKPSLKYAIDATQSSEPRWLRYRHLQPKMEDWDIIEGAELPHRLAPILSGQMLGAGLIRDHYAYNEFVEKRFEGPRLWTSGLHWVGDLGVEAWVEIQAESGTLLLETTEGGVHFQCHIDIASGETSLSCSSNAVTFVDARGAGVGRPTGQSPVRGPGRHRVMLMNADDRLFVWVDDRPLYFGGLPYQDFQRNGPVVPAFSTSDPGDSLPLGIGCKSTKLQVNRLRVWRDVYYTDQASAPDYRVNIDPVRLNEILDDPATWGGDDARELFASRARNAADLRTLEADQYFPMGDNSPASQDARVWGYPPFVKRDLLLGRGLFLYWPHSLNRPIYGFPDFTRMKFIR